MTSNLAHQISRLKHGDHLCMIYENVEDQMAAVVPFIRDGIRRGEKCVYVADDLTLDRVADELAKGGVDVGEAVGWGSLDLVTKREAYLKSGSFDPGGMVEFLGSAVEKAAQEGFTGFRVTGEMTWALGSECGCERIIEYEALLGNFFPGSKATAICQYNRNRFPASTIRDVLRTHPLAIVGNQVCQNLFYEPPALVMESGLCEDRVAWMISRLQEMHAREVRLEELNADLTGQKVVLERMAEHAPVGQVLDAIAEYAEKELDGWTCGFHLMGRDGRILVPWPGRTLAAHAGEGWEVAEPCANPSVMAALLNLPSGSEDLEEDARWAHAWREAALRAGWRSVLSIPVTTPEGDIQGTLDLVCARGRTDRPGAETVETLTHLAGIALKQHKVEESLRLSEERLRQSQKMDAIGRLAGGVAHDFNNMLTAINGYGALLMESLPEGGMERSHAEEIMKAGEKAAALTHQLLAFSRKQKLSPAPFDLNAGLEGMTRMLERILGEDIEIRVRQEPRLPRIKADASQVNQVILNLAVNAKEAMPAGGTLTLETRNTALGPEVPATSPALRPGEYVELSVRDTGTGMDRETMAQIFEPFFTTKDKQKSSGLGLATVYGAVSQSGGGIAVASEPGRGALFRIFFPKAGEDIAPEEPEALPEPSRKAQRGKGETILVAEDEDMVRHLVVGVLQGEGYRVLEAPRGAEALRIARGHAGSLDLLLTDVIMPGMGGRELASIMAEEFPGLPVLYMSGYTGEAGLGLDGEEDAAGFIGKPFTPAQLAEKVQASIGKVSSGR
jgi:signal transduction histidine kinase